MKKTVKNVFPMLCYFLLKDTTKLTPNYITQRYPPLAPCASKISRTLLHCENYQIYLFISEFVGKCTKQICKFIHQ